MFEAISSFKNTSHYAWSSPAMSALQAALRNSPPSLTPTDPFGSALGVSRAALRARRPSDGCPGVFSGAANTLHACLGVALDAGEAHSERADDLDGGHPSRFSLDNLSAQAQRVGVLAPMLHSAQRHCTPIFGETFYLHRIVAGYLGARGLSSFQ